MTKKPFRSALEIKGKILTLLLKKPLLKNSLMSKVNLNSATLTRYLEELKMKGYILELPTKNPLSKKHIKYTLTQKGNKTALLFLKLSKLMG